MEKTTVIASKPTNSKRNVLLAAAAALAVIIVGYYLAASRAAGSFVTVEPDTATLSGNAELTTDQTYGKAIYFKAPPVEPPSGGGGSVPTPENTGVVAGTELKTHTGNLTITSDGTSISNLNITGSLFVVANNVTVTNVKVGSRIVINQDSNGNFPHPVKKNMTFKNVEARTIDNVGLEKVVIDKAKLTSGASSTHFQATNYSYGGKLWQCNDLTLINSYFAQPPDVTDPATHREAFHPMGCTNVVVRNNYFNMLARNDFSLQRTTAIVNFETRSGIVNENVVYDGNYHYGGGYYQVYLNAKNMKVINNRFYTYPGGTIVFPPRSINPYYPFEQSNNYIDDKPATLPNSK